MSTTPKALELAKYLEQTGRNYQDHETAAELRRQHGEIEGLRAQVEALSKPQEPVAALLRYKTVQTPARLAFDGKDHYRDWTDWEPCTLKYAQAKTDPASNYDETAIYEMQPLYAAAPQPEQVAPFQTRVQPWLMECFGEMIAGDREERNHRFLEEALELVQACGCTAGEAHQLVDYVFGRPVGEPAQEVGGVMVTLAALCLANGLDMHANGETELTRINAPEMVKKIRAKQAAKPKYSPLPEAAPQPEAAQKGGA
jgi:hypothetical protein